MTRPRSFGARAKKEEQLGRVRGIGEAASALDAPTSPDSGDMRLLPMDEVRVDPNNPRRLNLTWALLAGAVRRPRARECSKRSRDDSRARPDIPPGRPAFPHRGRARRDRQAHRLRRTPLLGGEGRRPCVHQGYRAPTRAREHRARAAHREHPAQADAALRETVLNLRSVIERESELGSPVRDATDLMDRTGLTRATAYRYWRYMDLPEDVEPLLAAGNAEHPRRARSHPQARNARGARVRTRALPPPAGASAGALSDPEHPGDIPRRRGRPRTAISFGSTKNAPSRASSLPDPRPRR